MFPIGFYWFMIIDINTYNLCKSEKLSIVLETHNIISVGVHAWGLIACMNQINI